jgi:tetratricopeptide (TPR) repeat protein
MKKKSTYLFLVIIFFSLTAFVVFRYNSKFKSETVDFYPLKERKGAAAKLPEWASVRSTSDKLIRIVREKPDDVKSAIALASLYLQEARITGDFTYYNAAALKYVDDVLVQQPQNFNALVLKSMIQLSQHHFPEALATADGAVKINPYNAFVHGLLVDGNVEMGKYQAAVGYADKMMSIRPDIRSYARVAYLREIHGDLPGAIEAMNMAVESGAYGDESTEWCRVQLAQLYEQTGQAKHAEMHYTISQQYRPGYVYALAGLSRMAAMQKDYPKAIKLCKEAIDAGNDYSLKQQLAELHLLSGNTGEAKRLLNELVKELTAKEEGESGINHHAGMEVAQIYLMLQEPKKALAFAQKEYNRRPDNIDVNETLAWVYYKTGDTKKALTHMNTALKTGKKNPGVLCKAGLIYAKAGDTAKAKELLTQGVKAELYTEPGLMEEARVALQRL